MSNNLHPFDARRQIGTISQVSPDTIVCNLSSETQQSGRILDGTPLTGGQVGDFVVIDADAVAILARILEVKLPERERLDVERELGRPFHPHPVAKLHLLGSLALQSAEVTGGVSRYPSLGSRVYAASAEIVTHFANSVGTKKRDDDKAIVTLALGRVKDASNTIVSVNAAHLFGRHCAVLGSTGGGKSTTVARIVEQALGVYPKIILLDPTGEYPNFSGSKRVKIGGPIVAGVTKVRFPSEHLEEGDYFAILGPSAQQGVKLREAIISLRLVEALKNTAHAAHRRALNAFLQANGTFKKSGQTPSVFNGVRVALAGELESPSTPFNFQNLSEQIKNECVSEGRNGEWYENEQSYGWCIGLVSKINQIRYSDTWEPVFTDTTSASLFQEIDGFIANESKMLIVDFSDVSHDFYAREIMVNLIGRFLLKRARAKIFREGRPLLVVLDEAHHFLDKVVGDEAARHRLDAFEKIAKEGRKYWLNLMLATQQPRDIPQPILSQMGTLVVHRLTNEADRKVVEAACGQLDAAAARFLPSLTPGQAAIIGVDFPIPLTVQITLPAEGNRPDSTGPDFSQWIAQQPQRQMTIAAPVALTVAAPAPTPPSDDDEIPF
jgi:uncharacterized protein